MFAGECKHTGVLSALDQAAKLVNSANLAESVMASVKAAKAVARGKERAQADAAEKKQVDAGQRATMRPAEAKRAWLRGAGRRIQGAGDKAQRDATRKHEAKVKSLEAAGAVQMGHRMAASGLAITALHPSDRRRVGPSKGNPCFWAEARAKASRCVFRQQDRAQATGAAQAGSPPGRDTGKALAGVSGMPKADTREWVERRVATLRQAHAGVDENGLVQKALEMGITTHEVGGACDATEPGDRRTALLQRMAAIDMRVATAECHRGEFRAKLAETRAKHAAQGPPHTGSAAEAAGPTRPRPRPGRRTASRAGVPRATRSKQVSAKAAAAAKVTGKWVAATGTDGHAKRAKHVIGRDVHESSIGNVDEWPRPEGRGDEPGVACLRRRVFQARSSKALAYEDMCEFVNRVLLHRCSGYCLKPMKHIKKRNAAGVRVPKRECRFGYGPCHAHRHRHAARPTAARATPARATPIRATPRR